MRAASRTGGSSGAGRDLARRHGVGRARPGGLVSAGGGDHAGIPYGCTNIRITEFPRVLTTCSAGAGASREFAASMACRKRLRPDVAGPSGEPPPHLPLPLPPHPSRPTPPCAKPEYCKRLHHLVNVCIPLDRSFSTRVRMGSVPGPVRFAELGSVELTVTIKHVARDAGVSIATASRALEPQRPGRPGDPGPGPGSRSPASLYPARRCPQSHYQTYRHDRCAAPRPLRRVLLGSNARNRPDGPAGGISMYRLQRSASRPDARGGAPRNAGPGRWAGPDVTRVHAGAIVANSPRGVPGCPPELPALRNAARQPEYREL